MTLQDRHMMSSNRPDKQRGKSAMGERDSATGRNEREGSTNGEKKKTSSVKRCFNCGARTYINTNCPVKNLGTRCLGAVSLNT